MYPLFHALLVEAALDQAQMFMPLLTSLGAVVTHAPDPARADRLMSLLLPDLLVVGVHPTTAHGLHPWLSTRLADLSFPTLLYTEHPTLPKVMALTLPLRATIVRWPCSRSELALLLLPLLGHITGNATPALVASPRLHTRQATSTTAFVGTVASC
jgi:hypothetical protein